METYQVNMMLDGTTYVLHPSGARSVIGSDDWARIQQQRAMLTAQHSKKVADSWYAQVLDLYALSQKQP
jgi:hypothetical protein